MDNFYSNGLSEYAEPANEKANMNKNLTFILLIIIFSNAFYQNLTIHIDSFLQIFFHNSVNNSIFVKPTTYK